MIKLLPLEGCLRLSQANPWRRYCRREYGLVQRIYEKLGASLTVLPRYAIAKGYDADCLWLTMGYNIHK